MNLISLKELRTFLEKKEDDPKHNDILETLIKYVSQRVESFTNRELLEASRTERYNGGRRFYPLPAYPISSSVAPVVTVDGSTQTVDIDYFVDEKDGVIEFAEDTQATRPRIVSITWTGGYAVTNDVIAVPDDIKRACLFQCAYEFRRRMDMGQTVASGPQGSTHVTNPADLLPEVKNSLKQHRKPPSGR